MSADLNLTRVFDDEADDRSRLMRCRICGSMTETLPEYMPHAAVSKDEAEEAEARMEAGVAHVCRPCALTVPSSLIKAAIDHPFDYALGLRSGHVIRFDGCQFHGQWVTVTLLDPNLEDWNVSKGIMGPVLGTPYTFDRGIDVRLDEIVWCADAPQGS